MLACINKLEDEALYRCSIVQKSVPSYFTGLSLFSPNLRQERFPWFGRSRSISSVFKKNLFFGCFGDAPKYNRFSLKIVKWLYANGAVSEKQHGENIELSLLWSACKHGNLDVVKMLNKNKYNFFNKHGFDLRQKIIAAAKTHFNIEQKNEAQSFALQFYNKGLNSLTRKRKLYCFREAINICPNGALSHLFYDAVARVLEYKDQNKLKRNMELLKYGDSESSIEAAEMRKKGRDILSRVTLDALAMQSYEAGVKCMARRAHNDALTHFMQAIRLNSNGPKIICFLWVLQVYWHF